MVSKDPTLVIRFHNAIPSIAVALLGVLSPFPPTIRATGRGMGLSDLVQFSKDDVPRNVELPAQPPAVTPALTAWRPLTAIGQLLQYPRIPIRIAEIDE